MRTYVDLAEYRRQLAACKRSAWRFEQQATYWVGYERDQFEKFLAGNPDSPADNPDLQSWFDRVRTWVAEGRIIGRVRILEEPPSDYQRWMLWMDRWNRGAGETIQYLSRQAAVDAQVIPQAGPHDWWLLDDQRLMLTHHDEQGRPVKFELVTDEEEVAQAVQLRAWAIAAANRESAALDA